VESSFVKSQTCAKNKKNFTQSRKGAKDRKDNPLRILCVSASLRALLSLLVPARPANVKQGE
jgi:hypothetical protein